MEYTAIQSHISTKKGCPPPIKTTALRTVQNLPIPIFHREFSQKNYQEINEKKTDYFYTIICHFEKNNNKNHVKLL